ncbi:MAG: T9SS type A sorting domain-containing protein [Richelia sp. RM2_1_2]|nr:T9SS type A sorting domain-containing protein [Richelia sp. RM2_1_2]
MPYEYLYPRVRLRCYSDNEIGLVKFSSEECDFLSSTKALQQENLLDFNCFWNNELKRIYLEMKRIEDNPVAVQLFHARGVVLLTQTLHHLQQEVSVPSSLQNGVYFVKISNKKGMSNIKKISIINY